MRRLGACALLAAAVSVVGGLVTAGPAAASGGPPPAPGNPQVVVSGLNNPRQLSLVAGDLYIAEAGRGGPTCSEEAGCIGTSGSVSLVRDVYYRHNTAPRRIVRGLLSSAAPDGAFAVGSDGVSVRHDKVFVAMTYAPPDLIPAPLPSEQAGKLLLARYGRVRPYADISAVEINHDPDGAGVDSNPYAVLALPGRQLVADAAGNTILQVVNGHVSVFAVLPDHDGHQAVPTSLAVGPHGVIYVGELNGENPGTARVWKLSSSGHVLGWIGGFTTVTGVAVRWDGTLYVSELFAGGTAGPPGQVTRVKRNGARTSYPVPFPAGIAVDHGHHVYVSAWSVSDSDGADLAGDGTTAPPGQVWRLTA